MADEKVFTLTFDAAGISGAGRSSQKLYDHGLGHIVPFEYNFTDSNVKDNYNVFCMADGFYIQLQQSGATTTANVTLFLRVYNVPILETFSAPPDNTFPSNKDDHAKYGVRILQGAQTNHGMQDREMSHFSLNTDAKPFPIHMHGLATAPASGTITLAHRLGYLPTFFLAAYVATGLTVAAGYPDYMVGRPYLTGLGTTLIAAHADTTNINLTGAGVVLSGTYAYLILKDPVTVAA